MFTQSYQIFYLQQTHRSSFPRAGGRSTTKQKAIIIAWLGFFFEVIVRTITWCSCQISVCLGPSEEKWNVNISIEICIYTYTIYIEICVYTIYTQKSVYVQMILNNHIIYEQIKLNNHMYIYRTLQKNKTCWTQPTKSCLSIFFVGLFQCSGPSEYHSSYQVTIYCRNVCMYACMHVRM